MSKVNHGNRYSDPAAHPFDGVPHLPCRMDPDRFFPDDRNPGKDATEICNTMCPIVDACLTFALQENQNYGVWGGMTATRRYSMNAETKAAHIAAGATELAELRAESVHGIPR